jgi:acetyl-CoA carboxylase biotin carboxyl carrier protein
MTNDLPLTPEDVNDIVAILDGSTYTHIDISTARFHLRVAREGAGWTQSWDWSVEGSAPKAVDAIATQSTEPALPEGLVAIRAPLPGHFYRSPQPGAAPFIKEGDTVDPDTTVGIIETMKLMNQVPAGRSGTVEEVRVESGSVVDADAVLILIRPE